MTDIIDNSYQKLNNFFDLSYDDTIKDELFDIRTHELFKLLQKLNITKKEKVLTGNIVLYIGIMDDGTGDYNWIRQYISLFTEFGYNKNQIYIIIVYLKSYKKFDKTTGKKIELKFSQALEEINTATNEEISNFLVILQNLNPETDKYFVSNMELIEKSETVYNLLKDNANEKIKKLISKCLYWFVILFKESYDKEIKFRLLDEPDEPDSYNYIKKNDTDECSVDEEPDYLNNSIVISFCDKKIDILSRCKNIKYISMSEGAADLGEIENSVITSGIGLNMLGLYSGEFEIKSKEDIIEILKIKCNKDEKFNTNTKYHIGYISTTYQYLLDNNLKFQYFLLHFIDEDFRYLFNYSKIKTFDNYMIRVRYFFSSLNIKIVLIDDLINIGYCIGYNISLNGKTIKVRYFDRLKKNDYLSVLHYSESPVYTTGDLSAQEALLLKKFIISDYIPYKIKFIRSLFIYMYMPILNKILRLHKNDNLKKLHFIYYCNNFILDDFFLYYKKLNFSQDNIAIDNSNILYTHILELLQKNIEKIVVSFKKYQLDYFNFFENTLQKIFMFKKNFLNLLALVYSFDGYPLSLPYYYEHETNNLIKIFDEFLKNIKNKLETKKDTTEFAPLPRSLILSPVPPPEQPPLLFVQAGGNKKSNKYKLIKKSL